MPTPKRKTYEDRVIEMLGDPKKADEDMREFRKGAAVLESKSHELLKEYPNQWIAVDQGTVVAHGTTLESVVDELGKLGVPPGRSIVRYISKTPRKLFLHRPLPNGLSIS